jgi:EAL domain-containing protein (putative c-di-GMP-specific phosphodiesterase class I)/CheY-like chemotaxis protein
MVSSNSTGELRPGSAYVLDDEPQIGIMICQVLGACGLEPRQFTSPGPLYEAIQHASPELIVLDLALGQSDAVEVIRQLETLKFQGKILLISGRDQTTLEEIAQIGKRRGLAMLDPLTKPFRVADLKNRLLASGTASQPQVKERPRDRAAAGGVAVDVRDALRNGWLELWYQPKIDLKSLTICGAEALLRARHPEHGIILPKDLLPPAGDPAYQPLSTFVIERAMADWRRFADVGIAIKLAVNVPASVMLAPDFVDLVRRSLPTSTDFPGLIIEVTEDEVIRDPDWIREVATQLKLYNVQISIDDFGSGYASLSRLSELPFAEVKIDRSFVEDCATSPLKHGLCQTIVDLAHRFDASVCAEGIATTEDLLSLVDMQCDTAQGALFADAMPAGELLAMVLARKNWRVPDAARHKPRMGARA